MGSIKRVVLSVVVLFASAVTVLADGRVQVEIRDGRVSIVATNATVGEILTEWAKVGQMKVENLQVAPRDPVTIELREVSEQQALATLLRRAGGYIASRRESADPTASGFERILVMAVSAPAPAKIVAATPAGAASAAAQTDVGETDAAQEQASMAQARAEQIAAARGQSVVDQTTDQGTGDQAAAGQGPARDTSARPVPADQQPMAVTPIIEDPINPGTVDDIPPQDPRAQAAFKVRQALEVADPRKFNFPKPVVPPKQPGGR